MSSDDLDDRIRSMMRDAVAAAPPAPELPVVHTLPTGSRRGWVWAGVGIAAAAAAVVALVLVNDHDERGRIVNASTTSGTTPAPSTSAPDSWPDGVTLVVASARGLEQIEREGDGPVVTRLFPEPLARAFQRPDGNYVMEYVGTGPNGGGVEQHGADGSGQLLSAASTEPRLEDVGLDGSVLMRWLSPTVPELMRVTVGGDIQMLVEGTGALQYSLGGVFVAGVRESETGGEWYGLTPHVGDGVVISPTGGTLARVVDGQLDVVSSTAAGRFALPAGQIAGLDVTDDWVVVNRTSGPALLVDAHTGFTREVPVADGWVTISLQGMTMPSPAPAFPESTTTVASTTTFPVTVAEGFPNCMRYDGSLPAGVEQGEYGIYSFEEIPSETITVSGRPALLQHLGTQLAVVLGPPNWCSTLTFLTETSVMSQDAFVQWLATVTVTEQYPAGMPDMALASYGSGAWFVGGRPSPITTAVVTDMVALPTGVVYFWADGEADLQVYSPATGTTTSMWQAADWVAKPVLRGVYRGELAFTVNDLLLVGIDGRKLAEGVPTTPGHWSFSDDGGVFGEGVHFSIGDTEPPSWIDGNGQWAVDPSGTLVASAVDGEVLVRQVASEGAVLYRSVDSDRVITGLDLRDGWLVVAYSPPGDCDVGVLLVEVATGRALTIHPASLAAVL